MIDYYLTSSEQYFRVAHDFSFSLFFCVVLLCVFTFSVPCCNIRCDFLINMMFGSSLPPVVCRSALVLFTVLMFLYA